MELTTPHPHAFGPSDPFRNPLGRASAVRRRVAAATAAVVMLGIGVWAGTQIGGSSAAGVLPARLGNAPLSTRVISPHSLPGFSLTADSAPVPSAYDWARAERSGTPAPETARLRSLGFLGGFNEQLHAGSPSRAAAGSVVEHFRTASGARHELAYQYAQLRNRPGASSSTFPVPTIHGAQGIRIQAGGHVDMSVLFTSGQYFYVIRTRVPAHAEGVPNQAELSAAAGTLYLSANGCVAANPAA